MNRPLVAITAVYILVIIISSWIGNLLPANKNGDGKEFPVAVIGIVNSEPSVADAGQAFLLVSRHLKTGKRYKPFKGALQVFLCSQEASVAYGDLVEIKGTFSRGRKPSNPGEFDYGSYLEKRDIKGTVCVFQGKGCKVKILRHDQGNPFISKSIQLKNRIMESHKKNIPEPFSSLFGSIIFGLKASPIPDEIRDKYQKAGVVHILVASGQQVSILIGVCLLAGRMLKLPLTAVAAVTSIITWSFASMAGFGSSILRAAIMGQVLISSMVLEREGDFYSSFSLAALVLLIMNPNSLFDIGFQLSFLATWSLVYLSPILKDQFSKIMPAYISVPLSVALSPVLVTTPVSVYNFSQLTFIAVASNILVVPMAELLTTLGFISTAACLVLPPLARIIDSFIYLVMTFLNSAAGFFAEFPGAYTYISQPPAILILLYFAIILYLAEEMRKGNITAVISKNRFRITAGILLVFIWSLFSPVVLAQKSFRMTVIDVGQGDSILLEMPDGENVLVDGGGKATGKDKIGSKVIIPFLHKKGINRLSMVVLTHPHEDHVGGLIPVLEEFKVDRVLDSSFPSTSRAYYRFLQLVQKNRIKYAGAKSGQTFSFGEVKATVLAPRHLMEGTESDSNNNSVIMRFVYGKTSFLLAGDAAFPEEEELLAAGIEIRSDVIKIGHHGSSTSSGYEFLRRVSPKIAVISVGAKNRYRHPSTLTLRRLLDRAVKIFRTDSSGAVIIESDGKNVKVRTVKGPGKT